MTFSLICSQATALLSEQTALAEELECSMEETQLAVEPKENAFLSLSLMLCPHGQVISIHVLKSTLKVKRSEVVYMNKLDKRK